MFRPSILILALATSGLACDSSEATGPGEPVVDTRAVLVPPPGYPVQDGVRVTQTGDGTSTLTRTPDGATADLTLRGQAPGNVLVYATIIFNRPEYCVEGEDRLPEPGPCRGNGPLDPRDGGIPEVEVAADAWSSLVVGADGVATFEVDLAGDDPLQRINGEGLLNPEGAVVFAYVMDKGPLVDEGLLRGAQMGSLYGGCQGPPALGVLPCRGVAVAQHLPR